MLPRLQKNDQSIQPSAKSRCILLALKTISERRMYSRKSSQFTLTFKLSLSHIPGQVEYSLAIDTELMM